MNKHCDYAVSGSLAWKAGRHELGDGSNSKEEGDEAEEQENAQSFFVESFYPSSRSKKVVILVQPPAPTIVPPTAPRAHPECITVSGVPCAATVPNGISIVVIDEISGCILQSVAFSKWSSVAAFLDSIPDGRIVAICCVRDATDEEGKTSSDIAAPNKFDRLGGFDIDSAASSSNTFYFFVGQLGFHPKWATNLETLDSKESIEVSLQLDNSSQPTLRLRSEVNTVPANITTRLPESVMPLPTQLAANNFQKRVAFEAFMLEKGPVSSSVVGYTTRPGAPVYLMDNKSFPFRISGSHANTCSPSDEASWASYHYLPEQLVPDVDEVKDDTKSSSSSKSSVPNFDIPIADDYFTRILGNQLLVKNASSTPTLVDTANALANTRLVALYFSAHWCGPCRGFTPMLIEFYHHLKEVAPTHGLEIIFVSSDRDEGQFQHYYGSMPFMAHPFANRALAQQIKSVFGVRGIPSLVVIDSMSGQIVVSPDVSRREVQMSCQRGEVAIEQLFQGWLDKVPAETKSMLDILALSCQEAEAATVKVGTSGASKKSKSDNYLTRKKKPEQKALPSTEESAARVKEIFTELVGKGMQPNAAAAEAIKQATTEHNCPTKLEEGTVQGTSKKSILEVSSVTVKETAEMICKLNGGDKSKLATVLSTAKKYVANVQKDPTNPRFRNFRLSNKVFDKITSNLGGIELLMSLGFSMFHSDVDFVASIPLSADLTMMGLVLDNLLKEHSG